MPAPFQNKARVGGSGFTIFTFGGQPLAFAQQVSETSPQPVAAPSAIHPMDEPYPVQVVTPAASSMGSVTLTLYELYNQKVWDRLAADVKGTATNPFANVGSNDINVGGGLFKGAVDLVDVFIRQAEYDQPLNLVKYIRPPVIGGQTGTPYAEQYLGCVITNIIDGETIDVGTMEITKTVTVAYRFKTRNGVRSKAFQYRDRAIG